MTAEITNWKVLVGQFGLIDNADGLLSAKQLSKLLTKALHERPMENNFYDIGCSINGEAIALFEFQKQVGSKYFFIYSGTAN